MHCPEEFKDGPGERLWGRLLKTKDVPLGKIEIATVIVKLMVSEETYAANLLESMATNDIASVKIYGGLVAQVRRQIIDMLEKLPSA